MKNFNNKQETVSQIIELLGIDSNYEFYSISFSSYASNLQGKYCSDVVTTIRREFKAEPIVSESGFVEFHFKFNNESIKIVLT